jgi:hypothetical protein
VREKEEVLDKFLELRNLKLRERKQAFLCRASINCIHNTRMRVKGKGQLGFCQNQEVLNRTAKGMFVCSEDETAQRCKVFECRNSEESVEADFNEILRSPARCGNDYPKLAMLIWFLQEFEAQGRCARFVSLWKKMGDSLWKLFILRWW